MTLDETIVTLSTNSLLSLIIFVSNHHGLAQFYFFIALLLSLFVVISVTLPIYFAKGH